MKKSFWIIGFLLLMVSGIFIYISKQSDNIETSIAVENKTSEKFESVGIVMDDKILLHKTNGRKFYFPKTLTSGMKEVSVIAIDRKGKIFKSQVISLINNKDIAIKETINENLKLNVVETGKDMEIQEVPDIRKWKVETDSKTISGSFASDTDFNYSLYILGKGGAFGISDTGSRNIEVTASWEKPTNKVDSWLMISK